MKYRWLSSFKWGVGVCLAGGVSAPGIGGEFSVSPLNFHLTQERVSSVLKVKNTDGTPLRIQITSLDWEHDGMQDVLTDTNKLLVNPPIFVLEPGKTQIVRLGVRTPRDWTSEKAYRLILDEVLPANRLPGLHTRLRISLPIFVEPPQTYSQIEWSLQETPSFPLFSAPLKLAAMNKGNVHTKITTLIVNELENRPNEQQKQMQLQTPVYILPGQRKEWVLENIYCPCTPETVRIQLQVQTTTGNWVYHLPVVPTKENDFYRFDQWKLLSDLDLSF